MGDKKRKRCENWLDHDKELLLELIRERVKVIENKNTDTNTNNNKKAAWNDLVNSFNGMCQGTHRTVAQVKVQWGIAKMITKKEKVVERRQLLTTGGGPQIPIGTELATDISSWLPNEFAVDSNYADSDSINISLLKDVSTPSTSQLVSKELDIPIIIEEDSNTTRHLLKNVYPPSASQFVSEELDIPILIEEEDSNTTRHLLKNVYSPSASQFVSEELDIHVEKSTKKKKKIIVPVQQLSISKSVDAIAASQIESAKLLHAAQMKNEEKRSRNLDVKYELLQEKLLFYKRKNME